MNRKQTKLDQPPPGEGTISTRVEQKQVEERLAIGAHVVYETIRREGEEELHRTPAALGWSALAAGLAMGFSFIAEGLLMAHLPDQPWRPLIASFGYCMGFLIVMLGRQQLFTENTLTVVLPLLLRKDLPTLLRMLRLWGVVLGGNLVGTFLSALCIGNIQLFDAHTQQCLIQIGLGHLGANFGIVLVRAIFAGWLIALMVWLLPGAENARVSIIIIVTWSASAGLTTSSQGLRRCFSWLLQNPSHGEHMAWTLFFPHYWVMSSADCLLWPRWATHRLSGGKKNRGI